MKKMIRTFFSTLSFFLLCLTLSACRFHHYGLRSLPEVERLSGENNFSLSRYENSYAPLLVATRSGKPDKIHVYIEGDGVAWLTKEEPSLDPTPLVPTAFKLALADRSQATQIYLGRPGQYYEAKGLSVWDWTDRRFSKETLNLYHQYLDHLKQNHPTATITLLGYSGGGAIALLLAATRQDIAQVITFAGLLDTDAWVKEHNFSPLEGSLNPADYGKELSLIQQHHFIGEEDTVVTRPVVNSYVNRVGLTAPITLESLEGVSHWAGWEDMWAAHIPPRQENLFRDNSYKDKPVS